MKAMVPRAFRAAIPFAVVLGALLAFAPAAQASGTLEVEVDGKGDVTGLGIDCSETGGDCEESFVDECTEPPHPVCIPQIATLTAGPDRDGFAFLRFLGCHEVIGRECHVSMSANKTVTVEFRDAMPPFVSIQQPSGGFLRGNIPFSASASDNVNVQRVDFWVRGEHRASDNLPPYSTSIDSTQLADGPAQFEARALDSSGLTSSAKVMVTIDNTAPVLTIDSGPGPGDAFPLGSTQSWTFTGLDETSGISDWACSVVASGEAPSFGPCDSDGVHSISDLEEGEHRFTVRLVDNVGLISTVSRDFAIDATAPETTIKAAPKKRTKRKRARFRFVANEPSVSFKCKLDRKKWRPCKSPYVKRVRPGKHRLKIRAIDAAGNREAAPAVHRWKVRRKRR